MIATAEQHQGIADRGKQRSGVRSLLPSASYAARITDPNNVVTAYTNDALGRDTYVDDTISFGGAASALGGAYTYTALSQVHSYTRGTITISGSADPIANATELQVLGWGPNGNLLTNTVNGTQALNNTPNAQDQNNSNTYNSNGDTTQRINAAGSKVNTVFDAWGHALSFTVNQAANDISFTQTETMQHDGLGDAQALQANGTAYSADANPGSTGTPGQQVNEYFVGSTFDTSGNQTADGTQYNWTILYQGQTYDAMPGVYSTAQGAFNPRQQSLEAPDLSVIQQGVSAYDPRSGWFDYAAGYGVAGSEIGLTAVGGFLGGPLGAIGVGALLSAINRGYLGGQTIGQSIEGGIADATGITGIYAAASNSDFATGQNLNLGTGGRIMEGVFGALGIVGDAAAMAQASQAIFPWVGGALNALNRLGGGGPAPVSAVVGGGDSGGAGAAVGPGGWVGTPGWAGALASFAVAANEGAGLPNPYLEGQAPVAGTRRTGVVRAAALEVQLVKLTGEGTLDWTPEEIDLIQQSGELPQNIIGHHINSVAQFPEWAGDPRNIMFVRGQGENLAEHGGSFQNATIGPLIDRAGMILVAEGGGE